MAEVIVTESLAKVYDTGKVRVSALAGIDLTIGEGEFAAVMGPSGSGKSTLMNVLGCLDVPTSGRYFLDGEEVSRYGDARLAKVRNLKVGFVFQKYNLLAKLTALQNVETPLIYRGVGRSKRRRIAAETLESVGLGERLHFFPSELSGGQQQRVAIARALVTRPRVLLADEPTGNLDSRSGEEIMGHFQELNRAGNTIILVTHSEDIAMHCRRIIATKDGEVVSDEVVPQPLDARARLEARS